MVSINTLRRAANAATKARLEAKAATAAGTAAQKAETVVGSAGTKVGAFAAKDPQALAAQRAQAMAAAVAKPTLATAKTADEAAAALGKGYVAENHGNVFALKQVAGESSAATVTRLAADGERLVASGNPFSVALMRAQLDDVGQVFLNRSRGGVILDNSLQRPANYAEQMRALAKGSGQSVILDFNDSAFIAKPTGGFVLKPHVEMPVGKNNLRLAKALAEQHGEVIRLPPVKPGDLNFAVLPPGKGVAELAKVVTPATEHNAAQVAAQLSKLGFDDVALQLPFGTLRRAGSEWRLTPSVKSVPLDDEMARLSKQLGARVTTEKNARVIVSTEGPAYYLPDAVMDNAPASLAKSIRDAAQLRQEAMRPLEYGVRATMAEDPAMGANAMQAAMKRAASSPKTRALYDRSLQADAQVRATITEHAAQYDPQLRELLNTVKSDQALLNPAPGRGMLSDRQRAVTQASLDANQARVAQYAQRVWNAFVERLGLSRS